MLGHRETRTPRCLSDPKFAAAQGDRERSLGLPVSPLMDRTLQGGMTRSQLGFFSIVGKPRECWAHAAGSCAAVVQACHLHKTPLVVCMHAAVSCATL